MLIFKGKLLNVFKRADYTDKKTGEVTAGKYQLEFMYKKEMLQGQGHETVLQKISIPSEMYPLFKDKINQEVEVPIAAMASNGRVIFYGEKR